MAWFSNKDFLNLVEKIPIISIDLCIIHKNSILLGMRNNEPAKNYYFTPGGRIYKNESIAEAIKRIANDELGFNNIKRYQPVLMGAWDHFYKNSRYSSKISTHYVNLPHYFFIDEIQKKSLKLPKGHDGQHYEWIWSPLKKDNKNIHPYVKIYIDWLISNLSLK